MEQKLAEIWREVLGIECPNRHDNFFALGGHSLLVVRLLTQLKQIGLNTTVREIFDASSLATLAMTFTRYQALNIPFNLITTDCAEIIPEMLPLTPCLRLKSTQCCKVPGGVANTEDIYGLAPLHSGMLFHYIKTKHGDPYLLINNMSFIDRRALKRYTDALQQVVERHNIFRTIFFWEALNEPAQVVLRHVPSLLTEIPLFESLNENLNIRILIGFPCQNENRMLLQ